MQQLWQQSPQGLANLFLSNLAQNLDPTPSEPGEPVYWTLDEVNGLLRCGDLRFEGLGRVAVGRSIGISTPYYTTLADLARYMNERFDEQPVGLWIPLQPEEVAQARAGLDAGAFIVWMSSTYGPVRASYVGIGPRWGAASEISFLAHRVSGALNVFHDQLPDRATIPKSLALVGEMLDASAEGDDA